MIRFDDLTREERYYSATILPYLFAYNHFKGLSVFEEYLKSQNLISALSVIDHSIQILTEIYIERDLPYYKIEIPASSFEKKLNVQSKPDILIISEQALYIFECKVFMNESEYKLHQQILKQKYVFDIIKNTTQHSFINNLHILILPYEYDIADCVVITWEKLYSVLNSVIPKDDYFLMRLESAIQRIKI
ncbi:MAG: hypothetical protein K9I71_10295 [Ignavibacteriales bacterium]|nr:hypothetical protein [Ignavibacteriales bacterium]MCF8437429.1 hypothetical protein [Ignavibacteriales bacterium]